jgi:hypothetical protein
MLKKAVPSIEELISMRNAVEHPDGFNTGDRLGGPGSPFSSGSLIAANAARFADLIVSRPVERRRVVGPGQTRRP